MTTTYYRRAPAFDSLADILDWSERNGVEAQRVERGIDGTWRGSVEARDGDDNQQRKDSE